MSSGAITITNATEQAKVGLLYTSDLQTMRLDEGYTENQIYEYLKIQYGDWILYNPKFNKNTFFLWLLPIVVFVMGGWLIFKKTKFYKL